MDFLLFGIQGSGKGTHGKKFCEEHGFTYFETGGELRRLASQNSHLGRKIKSILEAGRLVPNTVVMEIVENFLKNLPASRGALFDGIPRNEEQAHSLETLLEKFNRHFMVVLMTVPREVALERLLKRRLCEKCKKVFPTAYRGSCDTCGGNLVKRSDDTEESIRMRFSIFDSETIPVVERYRKEGKLIEVNGHGNMDEVQQNFTKTLLPYAKVHD